MISIDFLSTSNKCNKLFGDVLFGDSAHQFWFKPEEKNTDIENNLMLLLNDYIKYNIDIEDSKDVIELYNCRKYFEKLLTPKETTMWRGIGGFMPSSIETLNIKQRLNFAKEVKLPGIESSFYDIGYVDYVPRRLVESWSTSANIAYCFTISSDGCTGDIKDIMNTVIKEFKQASGISDILEYLPLLYSTKTDNSFFGTKTLSNAFRKAARLPNENEIFRLGKKIRCKIYMPTAIGLALRKIL